MAFQLDPLSSYATFKTHLELYASESSPTTFLPPSSCLYYRQRHNYLILHLMWPEIPSGTTMTSLTSSVCCAPLGMGLRVNVQQVFVE